jgi:hypothetical protein
VGGYSNRSSTAALLKTYGCGAFLIARKMGMASVFYAPSITEIADATPHARVKSRIRADF